jgi:plasmid stabilization system protein ParE
MTRYLLTPEAQEDVRRIRDYLTAQAGPRVARRVLSAFVVAFRRLARAPGIGHRREDLTADEGLRFWAVFSYLVAYHRESNPLTIVAVIHG